MEAEKLEQGPRAASRPIKGLETKHAKVTVRADSSTGKNKASASPPRVSSSPPPSSSSKPAVRLAGKKMPSPRDTTSAYRAKVVREILRISRLMKKAGHPFPLGDPASGVVLVVEQPVGHRVLQALDRSQLLATKPHALIAIGAGAARDIDATGYSLIGQPFSEADPGVWFTPPVGGRADNWHGFLVAGVVAYATSGGRTSTRLSWFCAARSSASTISDRRFEMRS